MALLPPPFDTPAGAMFLALWLTLIVYVLWRVQKNPYYDFTKDAIVASILPILLYLALYMAGVQGVQPPPIK